MLHLAEKIFFALSPILFAYCKTSVIYYLSIKTQQKYLGYTYPQANIDQWPENAGEQKIKRFHHLAPVSTKAPKPFIHQGER
jgi:hypothetical protein